MMSLLPSLLLAFFVAFINNSFIYAGIAFTGGELLPKILAPVYGHTNAFTRSVATALVVSSVANYLFAFVYHLVDPAIAGMVILVSLIIVLIGKSALLGVGHINPRLIASTFALMLCALWVSYELHRRA